MFFCVLTASYYYVPNSLRMAQRLLWVVVTEMDHPRFFIDSRQRKRLRLTGDFTILVADRNPHVREFLRREMAAEGYHVCLARNARELEQEGLDRNAVHLLILDPDLPGIDLFPLLQQIERRNPSLQVVVHALPDDHVSRNPLVANVTVVEKGGSSIEHLKRVVAETRRRMQPPPLES